MSVLRGLLSHNASVRHGWGDFKRDHAFNQYPAVYPTFRPESNHHQSNPLCESCTVGSASNMMYWCVWDEFPSVRHFKDILSHRIFSPSKDYLILWHPSRLTSPGVKHHTCVCLFGHISLTQHQFFLRCVHHFLCLLSTLSPCSLFHQTPTFPPLSA